MSQIAGPSGSRPELVSNIVTLNIVPAPPAWVKQQIADAVAILDGPVTEDTREPRLRAGRTLRFLESPEAAVELARHLDSGDDMDSLLASPYRKQLLPVMEARLVAPDQPVWDHYLDTLTRLSQKKRTDYVARLIASLPAKQPEARVVSMNTLLDSFRLGSGDTSWLPVTAASLITDFRSLPSRIQENLLVSRWSRSSVARRCCQFFARSTPFRWSHMSTETWTFETLRCVTDIRTLRPGGSAAVSSFRSLPCRTNFFRSPPSACCRIVAFPN